MASASRLTDDCRYYETRIELAAWMVDRQSECEVSFLTDMCGRGASYTWTDVADASQHSTATNRKTSPQKSVSADRPAQIYDPHRADLRVLADGLAPSNAHCRINDA
jgi:hypothetical protein